MYFILLKRSKIFYLFLALVILFGFLSIFVKAEEDSLLLPPKSLEVSNTVDDEENYYDSNESTEYNLEKPYTKTKKLKNVDDSLFVAPEGTTLRDLFMRISFIVLMLFGVLLIIKVYLSRRQFGSPGNFLDSLTHKFASSFLPHSTLKLIQTMMLTPGQNLYMVEVEGKKLLLGGTQQGGIQFLADLNSSNITSNLDFKQIEEYQNTMKHIPSEIIQEPKVAMTDNSASNSLESPFTMIKPPHSTQMIKRRMNFKKSLLSNVK